MKKLIKKIFREFGIEITRYTPNPQEKVISLKPQEGSRGNVLISYIIKPFLLRHGEPIPNNHNHYWRSFQMAKTFLDLGYSVDVIDYNNETFIPQKEYSFFIDVRHNLERLSPLLNQDCIKIMYIDSAHILFHIAAECQRLLYLQKRKRVTLRPRRFEIPNLAIEYADFAITHGNDFTMSTFRYANKPIYRIPQLQHDIYPYLEDKNYEICRKYFLWFGSGGFVHKGLDLVLDVFTKMQDYHLYICGPIQEEEDFVNAYHDELFQTPNIHTVGWVDVGSSDFIEIANRCVGLIYPSCSEGGAGSVIQCMHAGLIPIVSYESGVDVHDFGVILNDCSIDTIRETIQKVSNFPDEDLRHMSRKTWEFARANHTRERFAVEYKKVILKIMQNSEWQSIGRVRKCERLF